MLGREEIVQYALGLPPEDRAFVAAELEHSLTIDYIESTKQSMVAGSDLLLELRRRSAALRSRATTARPATEVLSRLLQRQAAESLK